MFGCLTFQKQIMVVSIEREAVEIRRSKVCRRLFADSDDDENNPSSGVDRRHHHHHHRNVTKAQLENDINSKLQQKIEKWNFDFVKGFPLLGRYCWMPVSVESVESATKTAEDSGSSRKLSAKITKKGPFHPYKNNQQRKSHQTILHDFFKTTKRPNSAAAASATSKIAPNPAAAQAPEFAHSSPLVTS